MPFRRLGLVAGHECAGSAQACFDSTCIAAQASRPLSTALLCRRSGEQTPTLLPAKPESGLAGSTRRAELPVLARIGGKPDQDRACR
jgi:hypothetical protein